MVKLSICIPVYNQEHLVKEFLISLLKYEGSDIEIVISDDNSSQDIESLVQSLSDNRIKYYKTDSNLGHDLNILHSFKKASSNFVYLFRVRDRIIIDSLSEIIRIIDNNSNLAYMTGTAVNQSNNIRLMYKDSFFPKSIQTVNAHNRIYLHPSGSIYNKKFLDLGLIESFLKSSFSHKYGFVVHSIIRAELSLRGDFRTLKNRTWIYQETSLSKDVAVNSTTIKKSVYHPDYVAERFISEMKWIEQLSTKYELDFYKNLIKRYLYNMTWGFKRKNSEKRLLFHYNSVSIKFNLNESRMKFVHTYEMIFKENNTNNKLFLSKLNLYLRKELFINKFLYPIKYYTIIVLYKLHILNQLKSFFRRVYKKGTSQ